ncbi:DNA-binding transcriptional regulator [Mesorhizobium loti]|uniref:DNA-binding transcriptional regulator n=1 Tax=Rhizobium loti TaxID=381 RepID=A0A117N2R6_RHILI|nr:DNA-binding transcriptional regulator [Mesorhizobium loti]
MAVIENEKASRFPDAELKARAAWHYYVEGLTQERISEILGIGRIKVHRILSAAREEGVVQFRIRDSVVECVQLEESLKQRFGLSQAVVVPSAADRSNTPLLIGHAAAAYLADNVNPGDVIALGWGRTLKFAINELPRRPIARTTVVSMLGGLTHAQPLNPTESAWEFAEKIGAECYLLPVPVYADRPEQRDAFMSQRSVQDVVFRARRANIAVLSVGSFSSDSPIANYGFIKPSELEELQAAGAVGDILCHFIDAEGRTVDHEVNRRVCAYPLQDLSDIPTTILVSGGQEKIAVMRAALANTKVSVLITDEDAAKGLLGR